MGSGKGVQVVHVLDLPKFGGRSSMKKLMVAVTTTVWVLMLSIPILAHHGGNLFDMRKPVTLKGTVTKFEWGNPHNKIYFDVSDERGNVTHWIASTEPPAAMLERGWTRKSLNPGDQVTVSIFIAKNGAPTGNLHNIVLGDGKVLDAYEVGENPGISAPRTPSK
jgi:hypothetical protein